MKGYGRDDPKWVARKGLSEEGTPEHRAREGGTHAKTSEEFSMEEGSAGQRSRGRTSLGCLKTNKEASIAGELPAKCGWVQK